MQDRPEASELINAVASFVERELLPTLTDPRLRFRALVAVNVLSIVEREIAQGEAMLFAEWQRLLPLLGRPTEAPPPSTEELHASVLALNRQLCARIRAGDADAGPWYEDVLAHAEATVIEKLRVANPRYLERVLGEDGSDAV